MALTMCRDGHGGVLDRSCGADRLSPCFPFRRWGCSAGMLGMVCRCLWACPGDSPCRAYRPSPVPRQLCVRPDGPCSLPADAGRVRRLRWWPAGGGRDSGRLGLSHESRAHRQLSDVCPQHRICGSLASWGAAGDASGWLESCHRDSRLIGRMPAVPYRRLLQSYDM